MPIPPRKPEFTTMTPLYETDGMTYKIYKVPSSTTFCSNTVKLGQVSNNQNSKGKQTPRNNKNGKVQPTYSGDGGASLIQHIH